MGYEDLAIQIDRDDPARAVLAPPGADAVPFAARRPARVLEKALATPPVTRPAVLAEYWHLLLTGAHHDAAHGLAVALDARGGALADPPDLLAATLATAARRVPPGSDWRVAEAPAGASDLETALRALADIPGDLDFVRGWALAVLRDPLAGAGWLGEARRLAAGLSDRFDARRDTLTRLDGTSRVRRRAAPENDAVRCWRLPCDLGTDLDTDRVDLPFFVGRPAPGFHPLHFQAAWVRERRGGRIPAVVLDRVGALVAGE